MNDDRLTRDRFVVCMGGNGSLVLESLIHMCALGVMQCDNLHALVVELDLGNGNFDRTKELYDIYHMLQNYLIERDADNYFVPQIHLYTWMPLNQNDKVRNTIQGMIGDNVNAEWISRLFFTQEEIRHEIDVGFKGHPNIGVLFMQDIITHHLKSVEQMNAQDRARNEGIERYAAAFAESTEPRLMFIGSCFGGTGAACLPAVKRFLQERIKMQNRAHSNKQIHFGMLSLLPFFNVPLAKNPNEELAINSNKFQDKVKTVLNYYLKYELDVTPESSLYQHIYLLGSTQRIEYPQNTPGRSVQRNPASFISWFACTAVEQFFTNPNSNDQQIDAMNIAAMTEKLKSSTQLHLSWLEEGPMEWSQISHRVFPNLQARCAGMMQVAMYYLAKMHYQVLRIRQNETIGKSKLVGRQTAYLANVLQNMSGQERDEFCEGIRVFSKYISSVVRWFFEIVTHLPVSANYILPESGKQIPEELQEYLNFHRTDLKSLRRVLSASPTKGGSDYFEHMLRSLVYQKFFNGYILCKMEQKRLEFWPDDEETINDQIDRSPMVNALMALWNSNGRLRKKPVINILDDITQTHYLMHNVDMEHITLYLMQQGIQDEDPGNAVACFLEALFQSIAFWRQ